MHIVWFSWKDHAHPTAGGAEVVKSELARRLAKSGHKLTIITSLYKGVSTSDEHNGYKIVRVKNLFRLGVYWNAWRYYKKYIATTPDIVIDEMNTIPFFAKFYSGAPTVLFAHQLARRIWFHEMKFPLSLIGYFLEPLYIWMLRKSPAITVSESTKKDLVRFGFNPSKVFIIPEGITIEPAKKLPIHTKQETRSVLILGSIRSMKGTLNSIKAFELAKQQLPDLQLVVAGSPVGAYGKKVQEYLRHSKYAKSITVHNWVSPDIKRTLMQTSHVILSAAKKEGWGLTISEAASQGALPIVYDVDGLRDAAFLGKGGLLTKPTPADMARAIVTAFTQDQSARRLYAYQQSKRMTFDRSYEQFVNILQNIAQR